MSESSPGIVTTSGKAGGRVASCHTNGLPKKRDDDNAHPLLSGSAHT